MRIVQMVQVGSVWRWHYRCALGRVLIDLWSPCAVNDMAGLESAQVLQVTAADIQRV